MTESDTQLAELAERAVNALEAIAEHLGVLATMALTNATPQPATEQAAPAEPKRRGRPRKDTSVERPAALEPPPNGVIRHTIVTPEDYEPVPELPREPTEDERKAKFDDLKAALKGCLAMHGEDVTRQRLQFARFSEVPFDAIDATIERLEA